jgi:aryl-alcohol dehydrogenase-like predicted oxidoreductase
MNYKIFGRRTGLRVSELALGTGNFGTGWGYGAEPEDSRKMFDRFVQAGGTFIDTADAYQFGQSERLVGEFIASDRDTFVLATKYTLGSIPKGGVSRLGNSRKNMMRSVEHSLERLNTDRIDLYWVHFPDDVTPVEEILRGFDDLVRAGKILYAGLSNFPAWRVARAVTLADVHGWAPVVGVQIEYSLADRTADREILPMAEGLGLGAALWSPLGGGFLTGKYRNGEGGRRAGLKTLVHSESSDQKTAILDEVLAIAREIGATPSQVAVAWLRHRAAASTTAFLPIIGPRTVAQLDDYLGSLETSLTAEQVGRLTSVSAVPLGVPHEAAAGVREKIAGGDSSRLGRPASPSA